MPATDAPELGRGVVEARFSEATVRDRWVEREVEVQNTGSEGDSAREAAGIAKRGLQSLFAEYLKFKCPLDMSCHRLLDPRHHRLLRRHHHRHPQTPPSTEDFPNIPEWPDLCNGEPQIGPELPEHQRFPGDGRVPGADFRPHP